MKIEEKEINIIKGKMLIGKATEKELTEFLEYVAEIEMLVEEASKQDFYGTEGYKHRIGWD